MTTTFNKNALIALAYLKSDGSPVKSISQLIYYSMTQVAQMTFDLVAVRKAMSDVCKLELPVGIIKICLVELCKTKHITYNRSEKNYTRSESKKFDLTQFETKLSSFSDAEQNVSNGFISFAKTNFSLDLTQDTARVAIEEFLTCGDNAVSIFIGDKPHNNISYTADVKISWYFASYLDSVKSDATILGYVQDLAYGYAKCIGLLGSSDKDGNINIDQGFSGTEFYFDTKLILRYLGYSFDSEVKAVKELVSYIRKSGGLTRIFQKNLDEVGNALYRAARTIKYGHSIIDDDEMGIYISNPENATSLISKFENNSHINLLQDLLQRNGFALISESDARWNNRKINSNNIDVSQLSAFISTANPRWKKESIDNDVDAINRINRLRNGDYYTYFGGKRKLPVFVTSNYFLVKNIYQYTKEQKSRDVNWGGMCLPIISDSLLTYNIWVKGERNGLNVENAVLSKMTFALNHSSSNFRTKLIEETKKLQITTPDDVPFMIETAHTETLRDIVKAAVSATQGNADNITPEIIIASEKEAVLNRTQEQNKAIASLSSEKELLIQKKGESDSQLAAAQASLDAANQELARQEFEYQRDKYRFELPKVVSKKTYTTQRKAILPIVGFVLSAVSAIIGYIVTKPLPGICLCVAIAIITYVINWQIPYYKRWVEKKYTNHIYKNLNVHIENIKPKISGQLQYADEQKVIEAIRLDAYTKYDTPKEETNCG